LIEKGISHVRLTHSNYDTHSENFNFHFEQVGEFDGPFATLIGDLHDRGLLEHTLIVGPLRVWAHTEYQPSLWSRSLEQGLVDLPWRSGNSARRNHRRHRTRMEPKSSGGQVDAGHLFHTYLSALGLKSTGHFMISGQKMPMADPAFEPIDELLA
jgi:hypothetical protein